MVVATEAILFLVFVVAIGAALVKVFEWRQDVLYGRYVRRSSEQSQHTNKF
jgi:hypothetical protein